MKNLLLLGFYLGQRCIAHPTLGDYFLDGYYSKGVMARRNLTGLPEDEEYEMFDFEEIKIILKPTSDSLTKRFSDSVRFIKHVSDQGCWVGEFGEVVVSH